MTRYNWFLKYVTTWQVSPIFLTLTKTSLALEIYSMHFAKLTLLASVSSTFSDILHDDTIVIILLHALRSCNKRKSEHF